MSFDLFLTSLFDDGRVRAASPGPLAAEEVRAAEKALARCERDVRREFPGAAPQFDSDAALWAATMFYRAAQFTLFRDVDAKLIGETFATACPATGTAAAHYSVDLTFRFLPDLARLAKAASEADPLLEHLARWGCEWPLSSVGMANVEPRNLEIVANHAGLLALYADRVIARTDQPRLADPRVRDAVSRAVGAFPELAGKLASEIGAAELGIV